VPGTKSSADAAHSADPISTLPILAVVTMPAERAVPQEQAHSARRDVRDDGSAGTTGGAETRTSSVWRTSRTAPKYVIPEIGLFGAVGRDAAHVPDDSLGDYENALSGPTVSRR
jgi:hypothetical protein